jgi:uncharacterized protein YcfL
MKIKLQIAFVCLVTGFIAGCTTATNTYERSAPLASPTGVPVSKIIGDESLGRTFQITGINQTTVSGNLLKMQATVENLETRIRTLNYKIEWIDDTGMSIDSTNETWKSIQLQGRESQTIQSVAINPRAVDFRIKLRG